MPRNQGRIATLGNSPKSGRFSRGSRTPEVERRPIARRSPPPRSRPTRRTSSSSSVPRAGRCFLLELDERRAPRTTNGKRTISTITGVGSRSSQVRVEVENVAGNASDLVARPWRRHDHHRLQTQPAAPRPRADSGASHPPRPPTAPAVAHAETAAVAGRRLSSSKGSPNTTPDVLNPGSVLPVSAVEPTEGQHRGQLRCRQCGLRRRWGSTRSAPSSPAVRVTPDK